ncbi:ATP-binding protein, partial [Candidatus Geothermarchaeota archaeon ex4572_27]
GIVRVNPIKPLSAQVRSMIERTGVGVVVVASASSAFLASADAVVLMENYVPRLVDSRPTSFFGEACEFKPPAPRVFRGVRGLKKVRARGLRVVAEYADGTKFELDLSRNPRVVEVGQARLIAYAIRSLARVPRPIPVRELVRYVNDRLAREGFRALADHVPPDLTIVDGFDVVWTLNRLYNAVFTQERARV